MANLAKVATMATIAGAGRGSVVTVVPGAGGAPLEPAALNPALRGASGSAPCALERAVSDAASHHPMLF
jgi:hypothetical protein